MDRVTKRTIISAAHGAFERIGIVSPVIVCPKLLIKNYNKERVVYKIERSSQPITDVHFLIIRSIRFLSIKN